MKKIAKQDTKLRLANETVRSLTRPVTEQELGAVVGGTLSSGRPTTPPSSGRPTTDG
jgi:hypothetical protein